MTAFPAAPLASDLDVLVGFLSADQGFQAAFDRETSRDRFPVGELFQLPADMEPRVGHERWVVPSLTTPAALAAWLGISLPELEWFSDCQGREARVPPGPLRHYHYQWLIRRSGKVRLLEIPKPRLKALQRRVLREIVDPIPAHPAVHGYCRGRSVATYAVPHAGKQVVVRFDLRDFFPSIRASRIHGLFRGAGYPAPVARLLRGLCTNAAPLDTLEAVPQSAPSDYRSSIRSLYRFAHLPQGAPTSPALSNLCAYRLDCRLTGLAERLDGVYTRYADDLAFSGGAPMERRVRAVQVAVCRIALEECFEVHTRKTRFMRRGVRQQLAGIVLNVHSNVPRCEFDRLKALLHNCARHGPQGQNRAGHSNFQAYLAGRISYVTMINHQRGQRLRELFDQIAWNEPGPAD